MAENRETVNRIIASLSNLDPKLENFTQALEHEVFQVGQFVQLYLQLDAIIQIVRCIIWQANSYMEHIQLPFKHVIFRPSLTISYHTQKLKVITNRNKKIIYHNFYNSSITQEETFGKYIKLLLELLF